MIGPQNRRRVTALCEIVVEVTVRVTVGAESLPAATERTRSRHAIGRVLDQIDGVNKLRRDRVAVVPPNVICRVVMSSGRGQQPDRASKRSGTVKQQRSVTVPKHRPDTLRDKRAVISRRVGRLEQHRDSRRHHSSGRPSGHYRQSVRV